MRFQIPIWLGNLIELLGLVFGIFLILNLKILPYYLQILALFIAWFCFWYFSHCLAHFIVGKAFGLNFSYYFVGRSSITKLNSKFFAIFRYFPVLGIKVEPDSLKRISKKRKFIFYASGAIASMSTPAISLLFAMQMDKIVFSIFLLLTFGNIAFTLIFSSKVGDLYKARVK
ncbi:MAG: hypothetical protein NZ872_01790 [Archaeoglobaceae archaeon]|nr:hypothetical protein [Archaeoglobaceae archaeon]MDW8127930.1 hypothetical protein [Archaeoglobaceae archaeon]